MTAALLAESPAVLDAWLLAQFPGKTLEELDGIDLPRWLRALQAKEVQRIEELRRLYLQDKYKPTVEEWRLIRRHDRLVGKVNQ